MDGELADAVGDPPGLPSVPISPWSRSGLFDRLSHEMMELRELANSLSDEPADRGFLEEIEHRLRRLEEAAGLSGLRSLRRTTRSLGRRVRQLRLQPMSRLDPGTRERLHEETASLGGAIRDFATDRLGKASAQAPSDWAALVQIWLVAGQASTASEHVRQLNDFGYLTRWFPTPADAIRAAGVAPPDLFILYAGPKPASDDAPGSSQRCHAFSDGGTPFIIVAPAGRIADRIHAARSGAAGFESEPLDIHRLVTSIDKVLEKQHEPAERVLIVESEGSCDEHNRQLLRAAGMEVEAHRHPATIMEKLAEFRPELVLMDLCLTDCSGLDLAVAISQHERWSSLPIVHLSPATAFERQLAGAGLQELDLLLTPVPDMQLIAGIRSRIRRVRDLSERVSRDSLTGLLNHASIKEAAEIELARAKRTGGALTLAMIDIDRFKSVNDVHGHAIGDKVIEGLALLLRHRLRRSDLAGRYGGEEFLIVLPDCDAANAWFLLDTMRRRFQGMDFGNAWNSFTCSFSTGLACSTDFADSSAFDLLAVVDEALYAAKRSGRNKVIVAEAASPSTAGKA